MVESEGVLKKGWLMKRSQQLLQWRWRFVILTRGRLLTYTTVKEDVLTNEVELEGVEVEEAEFYLAAPLKYGFMVTTRDRTYASLPTPWKYVRRGFKLLLVLSKRLPEPWSLHLTCRNCQRKNQKLQRPKRPKEKEKAQKAKATWILFQFRK